MQAQPQYALHSIVSPRKSRFLQDFEEAAASLPVSPSSSLPMSPAQSLIPPQVHLTSSSLQHGEHADQDLSRRAKLSCCQTVLMWGTKHSSSLPSMPSEEAEECAHYISRLR